MPLGVTPTSMVSMMAGVAPVVSMTIPPPAAVTYALVPSGFSVTPGRLMPRPR
jgi:hypothetical protein